MWVSGCLVVNGMHKGEGAIPGGDKQEVRPGLLSETKDLKEIQALLSGYSRGVFQKGAAGAKASSLSMPSMFEEQQGGHVAGSQAKEGDHDGRN